MIYGFKISKNYAIDFGVLYKIRNFKDGITILELISNLDLYKADHNPQFKIGLICFNFLILEIIIYNIEEKDFGYD